MHVLQSPWKAGSQHLCLELSALSKIGERCAVIYWTYFTELTTSPILKTLSARLLKPEISNLYVQNKVGAEAKALVCSNGMFLSWKHGSDWIACHLIFWNNRKVAKMVRKLSSREESSWPKHLWKTGFWLDSVRLNTKRTAHKHCYSLNLFLTGIWVHNSDTILYT